MCFSKSEFCGYFRFTINGSERICLVQESFIIVSREGIFIKHCFRIICLSIHNMYYDMYISCTYHDMIIYLYILFFNKVINVLNPGLLLNHLLYIGSNLMIVHNYLNVQQLNNKTKIMFYRNQNNYGQTSS